jgi:peptidoglycan/xylan/chitin deacetylase (PgdA/CDA1 family)
MLRISHRVERFLKLSSYLLLSVVCSCCAPTKNRVFFSSNTTVSTNLTGSLPHIPRHFLEKEQLSSGKCLVRGNNGKKVVALTFDDGPTNLSDKILDVLHKNTIKATFFWQGNNLDSHPEIIAKAKKYGHQIANHSWDHTNGYDLDQDVVWEQQLYNTQSELEKIAGIKSNYYRPPFGAITQKQIDFFASKGITTVLWSLTTMDWDKTQNNGIDLENKFKNFLHPGAIVLMHDQDFGKSEEVLAALEKMIIYGKSQGYKFVTIEQIK